MTTALISDTRFLDHDTGSGHPETSGRLESIRRALEDDAGPDAGNRLMETLVRAEPGRASEADITRCHSAHLIDDIREAVARGVRRLDPDTVVSADSFDVACLAAGAGIAGIDLIMAGGAGNVFAAVRPPGHHAGTEMAMGFCLFNNAAILARYAQARYQLGRVLIIDWDVHHGNGTQEIFYRDGTVFYFSTHQYPYYPGTGARSETGDGAGADTTFNVPLAARTPATEHRAAFSDALAAIGDRFEPELVIVSAGFDSRRDDPLGGLLLEDEDFAGMTREVLDLADRYAGGRVVSMLEGGYNLNSLGGSVRAHLEALSTG